MKRWTLAMMVLSLVLGVTGCVSDQFGPSYFGSYDLRSVNGLDVPATVYLSSGQGGSYRLEVTYGALHLHGDGTYSMDVDLRETTAKGVVTSSQGYSGTYERVDSDLYLYLVDPVTNRDVTLSGFVRSGYVEVLLGDIVNGQMMRFGFER